MNAEIVSVGDELVSGRCVDTNAAWLASRLDAIGVPVRLHTTCGDDRCEHLGALQVAIARSDLIVMTGGLGPTQDDLTRHALAAAAGVDLVFHPESLEHIQAIFASMGRPLPERNRIQAMLPRGSTPIPNRHGTAPGIWMEIRGTLVAAMPGVPREMELMFEHEVMPRLRRRFPTTGATVQRQLHCFGEGESGVDQRLGDLMERGRSPELGLTVSNAVVTVRITARAPTVEAASDRIDPVADQVRQRLGEIVFGQDQQRLEHVVVERLLTDPHTLAVAESCTGGLVTSRLTDVSGVSARLMGGVVTYSDASKTDLVDVPADLIARVGAVSADVAEAMAGGVRRRFGTDYGLSTTGIAGPTGATPDKPVGLVYVALADGRGVHSRELRLRGSREQIKDRAAKWALNLLRLEQLGALPHRTPVPQ